MTTKMTTKMTTDRIVKCVAVLLLCASTASAAEYPIGFKWDLVADFPLAAKLPAQAKDSMGTEGVWSFRWTPDSVLCRSEQDFARRKPSKLPLLPHVAAAADSGRFAHDNLDKKPFRYRIEKRLMNDKPALFISPRSFRPIVVDWKSPVTGTVKISGALGKIGQVVAWYVDKVDCDGRVIPLAHGLADGGGFEESQQGNELQEIFVEEGEHICLSARPGFLPADAGLCSVAYEIEFTSRNVDPQYKADADPAEAMKGTTGPIDRKVYQYEGAGPQAFVTVNPQARLGEVNRKVFGACLIYPPFGDGLIEACRPFLEGSSIKVWDRRAHRKKWLEGSMAAVKKLKPAEVFVLYDSMHIKYKARYASTDDNNLPSHLTAKAWGEYVRELNRQPHPGYPDGYGIDGFLLWTEPWNSNSGRWPAEDYARAVVDMEREMLKADPSIKISTGLTKAKWDESHLAYLAKHAPDAKLIIDQHYYDTIWFQQFDKYGSYYGRVAGVSYARQRLRDDMARVKKYGKGKWELMCGEWNIHPQRYDWPVGSGTDLSVAIYQACMLQMFLEEGLSRAHMFHIRSGLFSLIDDPDAKRLYPTYHVFRMFGKYFRGQRVEAEVVSPSFAWDVGTRGLPAKPREIPFVTVAAASSDDDGTLCLMVANRHRDESIRLNVTLPENNVMPWQRIEQEVLTGDTPEAEEAIIKKSTRAIRADTKLLRINLPAHSVSCIRLLR